MSVETRSNNLLGSTLQFAVACIVYSVVPKFQPDLSGIVLQAWPNHPWRDFSFNIMHIEGRCSEGFSIHVECHEEITLHRGRIEPPRQRFGSLMCPWLHTTSSWKSNLLIVRDIGSHRVLTLEVCCGVTEWFMVAECISLSMVIFYRLIGHAQKFTMLKAIHVVVGWVWFVRLEAKTLKGNWSKLILYAPKC